MTKVIKNNKGMTLLEVIVVLAVLGALAAMLSPVVFRYIDDANQARAAADTRTIAAAIDQMYEDTGRWPFFLDGDGTAPYAAGDPDVLSSNTSCDGTDDVVALDMTAPTDGSTGATWALGTNLCDSLTRHLITNGPGYVTTGRRAWSGPYLDQIPATDPWDGSYLVNIINANPAQETPSTQKWVIVISAGPDGDIDTLADALKTSAPTAAGDDIIAVVK